MLTSLGLHIADLMLMHSNVVAVEPSCREMLDTACDIGRVPTDLAQQFLLRDNIDFSLLDPCWWLETGKFVPHEEGQALPTSIVAPKTPGEVRVLRETVEELDARIRAFVLKLRARPEQHIAIVGHSSYFKRMLAMNRKLDNCELHETALGDIQLRDAQQ